ncbi:hypothetical protein JHL17_32460 [Azospirillum sp. YIM B02556]|uniref:Uncharacterized protein n=1 Tax=Azospirillum endophyticum TaxID=2800326 RepID=A0ABS1FFD2_9PROT|nr:hypothetical protein [Azospirillum endophyticum]MBK1842119.1 hypothetical protein [Azospirillum endophyticum]
MTRLLKPNCHLAAPAFAALLLCAAPLHAQTAPPEDPAGRCSPTVSAALGAWDTGLAAAERFGDKAVAVAREKGREYLLPLLGIDPKTAPPDAKGGTTDDVGRALEESRDDPKRRAALCAAITRAADEAKSSAGAGLDSLRRALDNWQLTPPAAPSPTPAPSPSAEPPKQDGLIRT